MKSLICFLVLTLSALFSKAQWIQQTLGSATSLVNVPANGGLRGNLLNRNYTDTTTANLGFSDSYAGAMIFTTSDGLFWVRNSATTKWLQVYTSGGTPLTPNLQNVTDAGNTTSNNLIVASGFGSRTYMSESSFEIERTATTTNRISLVAPTLTGTRVATLQNASGTIAYLTDIPSVSGLWSLTGNSGTTAGTNFIGTTDAVGLMFKVNSIQSGYIDLANLNTSFGNSSLLNNTIGQSNTAIGINTLLHNTTGSSSVAVGAEALNKNTTGQANIGIGNTALYNNIGSGNNNIGIGFGSLYSNTNGDDNVGIGNYSGYYNTTASNQYFLNNQDRTNYTGDTSSSLAYGQFNATATSQRFKINGRLEINDGTQSNGYIAVSDANGRSTWTAPSGIVTATPTLQQVTTAGNTTTDDITFSSAYPSRNSLTWTSNGGTDYGQLTYAGNTGNYTWTLPNANGIIPISVNGNAANSYGAIVISSGAGSGTVTGTGTANQDAYWISSTAIGGSALKTFDPTSNFSQLIKGANGGGIKVGGYNATIGGIWSAAVTPSTANYFIGGDANHTYINSPSGSTYISSSGVAKWVFNSSGHFLASTDNSYDIGASGATRPRTGYFGTSINVAGATLTGTTFQLPTFTLQNSNAVQVMSSYDNVYAYIMRAFTGRTDVSGTKTLLTVGESFSWLPNAANTATYSNTLFNSTLNPGVSNSGGTFENVKSKVIETTTTGLTARYLYSGYSGVAGTTQKFYVNTDGDGYFAGNVGIGTTSPSARLHTISTTEQLRIGYDASNYYSTTVGAAGSTIYNYVGADKIAAFTNGTTDLKFGINTSTPAVALDVVGQINVNAGSATNNILSFGDSFIGDVNNNFYIRTGGNNSDGLIQIIGPVQMPTYGAGAATFDASGNITSVSDERLKTNIKPYKTGLKELLLIKPIQYQWNEKSKMETVGTYAGFSAQNVRASIPFGTGENKEGYLSLQDRALLAASVNAIKELSAKVDNLEKQNKQLLKQLGANPTGKVKKVVIKYHR